MRTLKIRFCIDNTQLDEIELEAPTGVSLRKLIKEAKSGLSRHFTKRSTRKPRIGDRLSSLGRGGALTSRGDDDLPCTGTPLLMTAEVDAMHGKLMQRLDAFAGCMDGSSEEAELRAIVDLIEACEAKWGPVSVHPAKQSTRHCKRKPRGGDVPMVSRGRAIWGRRTSSARCRSR
jgi:hypothetical protein